MQTVIIFSVHRERSYSLNGCQNYWTLTDFT